MRRMGDEFLPTPEAAPEPASETTGSPSITALLQAGFESVEGVWSLLRRGLMANTAFADPDLLTRTLRPGLAHTQRHPELIDGCLTETGLAITPHQSTPTREAQ